ncbi:baculoviral IAP repeat-containing protein 3-like isoform X2 [Mytilus galloprovincialis]|uniref:baculoviral IAP repeat-containing protein 3-like isoform X2 n=1 Tax=Mytilus galloprovincialis TaxID=29158 RepID=UPI003F7BABD9
MILINYAQLFQTNQLNMYIQDNQTARREPERPAMHQIFFPTDQKSHSKLKRRRQRLNSYPSSKTEVNNNKNRKLTVDLSEIKSSVLRIQLKMKHTKVYAFECTRSESNNPRGFDQLEPSSLRTVTEIKKGLNDIEMDLDIQSKTKEQLQINLQKQMSIPQLKPETGNLKSKNSFDWLHYLFTLRFVPNQCFQVLPVSLNTYFESLSSGSTMSMDESMSNNLLRLSSYSNFPRHVNVFVSALSKAGFYYTGSTDTVRCYACGITHQNWTRGDNPEKIHCRLSPLCTHLQKSRLFGGAGLAEHQHMHSSNNRSSVHSESSLTPNKQSLQIGAAFNDQNKLSSSTNSEPSSLLNGSASNDQIKTSSSTTSETSSLLNGETSNNIRNQLTSNDFKPTANSSSESTIFEHDINTNGACSESAKAYQNGACGCSESSSSRQLTNNDISLLGIDLEKPRYQNYAALQVRISSFQGWPSYLDQTPREMAIAGFLFAGYHDYTRCFFCGGGLRNWEAGDDPWVEHARWFPKCTYLRQNKGDAFIKAVQDKHEQMDKSDQITSKQHVQSKETTQNGSNLLSNSNPQQINSTSYLDTAAARSVLEMGYTREQALRVIQQLLRDKPERTFTALDIMTILLKKDENLTNGSTGSTSVNSTNTSGTSTNALSLNTNTYENEAHEPLANSLNESNLDDAELLVEENRQLRDQRLCKICLELDASIAFLPCGHLVCCSDCAPAMRKCPICRTYVKGTVKTFLI